jgi:hypothetical protein
VTDYSVTFTVPDYVYDRAQKIAKATSQPLEEVFRRQIEEAFSEPLPKLSPDEEAELAALSQLSDDALWTIAREQMLADLQTRMQELMDRNNFGTISGVERAELEALVERGNRLMLRKAEASALLTRRGHKVTPKDLTAQDG